MVVEKDLEKPAIRLPEFITSLQNTADEIYVFSDIIGTSRYVYNEENDRLEIRLHENHLDKILEYLDYKLDLTKFNRKINIIMWTPIIDDTDSFFVENMKKDSEIVWRALKELCGAIKE